MGNEFSKISPKLQDTAHASFLVDNSTPQEIDAAYEAAHKTDLADKNPIIETEPNTVKSFTNALLAAFHSVTGAMGKTVKVEVVSDAEAKEIIDGDKNIKKQVDNSNNNSNFVNDETEGDSTKRIRDGAERKTAESIRESVSNILDGVLRASQEDAKNGKGWSIGKYKAEEEKALKEFANNNNLWVEDFKKGVDPNAKGNEAVVFFNNDGKTVTKINSGAYHADWISFTDRLKLHEIHLKPTSYKIVGFTEYKGSFSLILEQPFVKSKRAATYKEVADDMAKRGFKANFISRLFKFGTFSNGDILIADIVGDNALITEDGTVAYIDPILRDMSNVQYMKSPQGEVLGFVQVQPDGSYKLWIDPKAATTETPIHEIAGHIFLPLIKKTNPELYNRGKALIKGTEYEARVKKEYPHLDKEGIAEEALAQAIGEKGKLLTEQKKKGLLSWLKDFWRNVKGKLKLNIPSVKLAEMTLGDFTDLIAGSVIHGEELSKIQQQNEQPNIQTKNNQANVSGNETSARNKADESTKYKSSAKELYNAYQTRNDKLEDYSLTPEMQRSTSEAMARRGQGFTANEWAGYENKLASDTMGKWNRAIESAGGHQPCFFVRM